MPSFAMRVATSPAAALAIAPATDCSSSSSAMVSAAK